MTRRRGSSCEFACFAALTACKSICGEGLPARGERRPHHDMRRDDTRSRGCQRRAVARGRVRECHQHNGARAPVQELSGWGALDSRRHSGTPFMSDIIPQSERRAPIVTVADAHPHSLAWLGGALGTRTIRLGLPISGSLGTGSNFTGNTVLTWTALSQPAIPRLRSRHNRIISGRLPVAGYDETAHRDKETFSDGKGSGSSRAGNGNARQS